MTSQTLRITMIVAAALAAVSVGACKPKDNSADANTASASDANAAANTAMSSANTATAAANSAANDAAATAPASTNSMSK